MDIILDSGCIHNVATNIFFNKPLYSWFKII